MKANLTAKESMYYVASVVVNILLWVLLVPAVLLAFSAGSETEAFGTGLYSQTAENLILTAVYLNFCAPVVIFLSALISLIFRLKKKYALSLWLQMPPILMLLCISILLGAAGYFNP